MPLERFYRLSEEKKQVIRQAAINEFTRVPIDKVSINRIIKEADISRGSFYTYFEDKWDLLRCIFEEWQRQMRQFCMDSIKKYNGNIWMLLEGFLDRALIFCGQNGSFEFIKNVMAHSNSEDMFSGFSAHMDVCNEEQDRLELWMYEQVDKSGFISQEYEDFHRFLMLAMSSMAMAMRDFYQGQSKEQVRTEFVKKLELLRHGVCSG